MISPQHAKKLSPLGVLVAEQLLLYLPSGYTDYSRILESLPIEITDDWVCLKVTTTGYPSIHQSSIPPRLTLPVTDGKNTAVLTVFGLVNPWKEIPLGATLFVRAKLKLWNGLLQIDRPERIPYARVGKIMPTYKGKKGVCSAEWLFEAIQGVLVSKTGDAVRYIRSLFDGLSDLEIFARASITEFPSIQELLYAIHRPKDIASGEVGLECAKRIAAAHLIHEGQKQRHKKPLPASSIPIDQKKMQQLIDALPFTLTAHQQQALTEISNDLSSPYPMFRLLSGDVNTGKTLVFGLAAALTHFAGRQAVILTPNILLARQIAGNLRTLFKSVPVLCIDGSTKGKIDLTGSPIIVGTTALFSRLPGTPDYLVIDEQQKLSRDQRDRLASATTNILEATATCIPRTAALVSHGGMDYSVIDQSPVERRVVSRVVKPDEKQRLLAHIQRVVASGGQVAVIYPTVTVRAGHEKRSAMGTLDMWEKLFPGRTAILHGKMSDEEKQIVIDGLMNRRYDIVVSTIILEVGLTLPSLKALVAVEADRFGLSQLHQLRGRVARTGGTGYFFALLPALRGEETESHLKLLEDNSDGYALAERDLELRGFGDLSMDGANQHGKGTSAIFVGLKLPYDMLRHLSRQKMADR